MKILILTLISIFTVTNQAKANDIGIEETFHFIYEKVSLTYRFNDTGNISKSSSIARLVKGDDESISSLCEDEKYGPKYSNVYFNNGNYPKEANSNEFYIPLRKMDPTRVEISDKSILLNCKEDRNCISLRATKIMYRKENVQSELISVKESNKNHLYIEVLEKRHAEQIKKAFIHLIKSCGGGGELF